MLKQCVITLTVIGLLTMTGCSKLTQENYSKIHMGMQRLQIEKLLGKPKECQNVLVAMNCSWEEGPASIHVQFIDNKVISFVGNKLK